MSRFARAWAPAPVAERRDHVDERHGERIEDPYRWLRERDDPAVTAYLEAENAWAAEVMAPTEPLQQRLYDEMLARIKEDDTGVPVRSGDWLYYGRTEKGKQYAIHCRRRAAADAAPGSVDGEPGPEQVILDGNALGEGQPYFALAALEPSHDHRLLAYAYDVRGDERYTLRITDLEDGGVLGDLVEGLGTSLEWAADGRHLFYSKLDEAHRPYQLWRHELGTPAEDDVLVYEEGDERFFLSCGLSKDRNWLVLTLQSNTTTEVHVLRADDPLAAPQRIVPRRQGIESWIETLGETALILTNDGAVNFRLCQVELADPAHERWREVLPHDPKVKLEGVEVFRDHIVVTERVEGVLGLRVLEAHGERVDPDAAGSHRIELDEPVRSVFTTDDTEYGAPTLRFVYSSPVTPRSVYDYDRTTRTRTLRKREPVLGGFDSRRYACERLEATAADGTRVPISLLYRRDRNRAAPSPLLLYGYGAYGISIDPGFESTRFSLVDRGFVYAIAHVRGGGDLGRPWYDAGKLEHKTNTFGDFVACAELLAETGWTSPAQLGIRGGSAGGLLIGAVVNARPELFGAAIAKVPFVDVVNTMSDASLPLTVTEWEEWGNPAERAAYETIRAYSPYDNVRAQAYPHLAIFGGLNDPRVAYWEPAKWAARLRDRRTDDRLTLLKTEMGAGHSGPSGRYDYLRELAFEMAFLIAALEAPESPQAFPD